MKNTKNVVLKEMISMKKDLHLFWGEKWPSLAATASIVSLFEFYKIVGHAQNLGREMWPTMGLTPVIRMFASEFVGVNSILLGCIEDFKNGIRSILAWCLVQKE